MKDMRDVTILLPAYQEEEAIGRVIDDVRDLMPECRILVAYNPSMDNTVGILKYKKVEWVMEPRKGKGFNVRNAFRFINSKYVVMLNSDYTYPVSHIPALLDNLEDVAIGVRAERDHGSMSLANYFGNKILSLMASVLYGRRIKDVCTGMWAFRREVLDNFELEAGGFMLEADLFVNCARAKCKIKQIPVTYRKRLGNSESKLRLGDGLKIGAFLIKKRLNWVEDILINLCPGENCPHYYDDTKYGRKCWYGPQCWRGRISQRVKHRRLVRYAKETYYGKI
jgi:glycosyltransferase involved in cell wall biosynthesis